MLKINLTLCVIFVVVLFIFSGCEKTPENRDVSAAVLTSLGDIPGITEDEISAIKALREQVLTREQNYFIYAMIPGSEAFLSADGEIRGYAALFCEWLTGLFDIPFVLTHVTWDDMQEGLKSGEIDFTGDFTPGKESRQAFFLTSPIAHRSLSYFRLKDSVPFTEITRTRPPKYALLKGTDYADDIFLYASDEFELIFISDYEDAYELLKSGLADALIAENTAEAVFDKYGDVVKSAFVPLIFSPVSLVTQNPNLEPVITAVQKALTHNVTRFLSRLYRQGNREYMRHKLFLQLTEEERNFINVNPVIPFLAENDNYPVSFFNIHENSWEGISIDVIREVEALTGLEFKVINDKNTEFTKLLKMLETGEALILSEVLRTPEREGRFLWPDTSFLTDHSVLISKVEFPNITVKEVYSVRVGVDRGTAHAELFRTWFYEHQNIVEFDSQEETIAALVNGDVDMVMKKNSDLLRLTHYMELPGYKVNLFFDNVFEPTFGLNKDAVILRDIVEKALQLTDIEAISGQWLRKTYDYRILLAQREAQRPWIIRTSFLFLFILVLLSILLLRNRNAKIQLERVVIQRTNELQQRTNELEFQTDTLKALEEEARSASLSKSAFLANMSHEMRTPMNVIVGLTGLMLEDENPAANFKENLDKVNTAGNILLGLINDILDISKIESGKFELMPVLYEIPSLLNDIITLNVIRIMEKPIIFNLDIDENLPSSFYGDELRIKQIFNNILGNAFKYTHKGTVTLGISCERDGDNVWMSAYVSDTGIGIREKDIKKLFTDYNQVDTRTNRSIEGTGLGLAITRRLVRMMDGEITAESEYGKGSTFRIRIRQEFVDDKVIGTQAAQNLRSFRYAHDKRITSQKLVRQDLSFAKVLVVDDMQTNLDVASGLLRKYKMQIDCVLSGREAIEKINLGTPVYNAVFMDHMMPEMDGIETTEKIRTLETEYAQKIPIIALTANAVQGTEEMFYKHGFQDFVSKPIDIMQLDSIVRKWISKKQNN